VLAIFKTSASKQILELVGAAICCTISAQITHHGDGWIILTDDFASREVAGSREI